MAKDMRKIERRIERDDAAALAYARELVGSGGVHPRVADLLDALGKPAWLAWVRNESWELRPETVEGGDECASFDDVWRRYWSVTGWEIVPGDGGGPMLERITWSVDSDGNWDSAFTKNVADDDYEAWLAKDAVEIAEGWREYFLSVLADGVDPLNEIFEFDYDPNDQSLNRRAEAAHEAAERRLEEASMRLLLVQESKIKAGDPLILSLVKAGDLEGAFKAIAAELASLRRSSGAGREAADAKIKSLSAVRGALKTGTFPCTRCEKRVFPTKNANERSLKAIRLLSGDDVVCTDCALEDACPDCGATLLPCRCDGEP